MKLESQIRKEESQRISDRVKHFNAEERRLYFEAYADGLLYIKKICEVSFRKYLSDYNN